MTDFERAVAAEQQVRELTAEVARLRALTQHSAVSAVQAIERAQRERTTASLAADADLLRQVVNRLTVTIRTLGPDAHQATRRLGDARAQANYAASSIDAAVRLLNEGRSDG